MKKLLFAVFAMALGLVACGSDEPVALLTPLEYSAQGNAICDRMNAELDGLSIRASSGVSPEEERALFNQASAVSRDAIDALFALSAPASLVDERSSLLAVVEERRQLIERLNNGEDLIDELTVVNQEFEDEAESIWPRCTTR